MQINLSISIVTHHSDLKIFTQVLKDLEATINTAIEKDKINQITLFIIDNSLNKQYIREIKKLLNQYKYQNTQLKTLYLKQNKGYGHAHNQVLELIDSDFHIFLNPDVLIDKNAFINAIEYMQKNDDVGMLSPSASTEKNEKLFLLKRYPSIIVLFIRGFFPSISRARLFKEKSEQYEMRDIDQNKEYKGVDIASGCFMFFRTKDIKSKFKFSEKFFLYFEDYDLTWQFSQNRIISYVPTVKIIHYGGNAAQKGVNHISYFIRSAITFFNRFGWKFI